MKKVSEKELGRFVCDWLAAEGWDVYEEVEVSMLGPRADIVAVNGPLSWIIEVKRNYSLQVMDQALRWLRECCASYISIAVPILSNRCRHVQDYFHLDKGIGLIEINQGWVSTRIRPQLNRTHRINIRNIVRPEHKVYCDAGSANGGFYTPFKSSVASIRRYLKTNPEPTIKDLVETCGAEFHWSSPQTARACIAKYIEKGIIEGIEKFKRSGERAIRIREVKR
jgi:hypothetical protein